MDRLPRTAPKTLDRVPKTKKNTAPDFLDQFTDPGRAVTAVIYTSQPGATAQPIPEALVNANTASRPEQKADNPKGVRVEGTVYRALTVAGKVTTAKSVEIKTEAPEAARMRAELEKKKPQLKSTPQPSPKTGTVSVGGDAIQAIIVGDDLEATGGIIIE